MEVTFAPASELSLIELADLFTRSFEGYVAEIRLDAAALALLLRTDGVDLHHSRVVYVDGEAAGLIALAPRGWSIRVAGMGVVAKWRGRGLGRAMLELARDRSREQAFHALLLEVIEQNPPAVGLYRQFGFETLRRLVGFVREPEPRPFRTNPDLREIDLREAARAVTEHGSSDLPFQVTGESFAHLAPPHRAYRLGESTAITSNPELDPIVLHSILVPPSHRRRGLGRSLVEALLAERPQSTWRVPARIPEENAPFLEALGFRADAITQFQMQLDLV